MSGFVERRIPKVLAGSLKKDPALCPESYVPAGPSAERPAGTFKKTYTPYISRLQDFSPALPATKCCRFEMTWRLLFLFYHAIIPNS